MEPIVKAITSALPLAWTIGVQQQLLSDEGRRQFWTLMTVAVIAFGLGWTARRATH